MSTRVALGVAGAGIGFLVGGPQGAAWGWALGSAAGGIIDPMTIKGPSIGDLAQQTSQEGVPIPIVIGMSHPIAGNIIAAPPPRIVKKKEGGKGGPKVVNEYVYRTYAIGVCEGPIGGFIRVWRNNTKVYDAIDPEFTDQQVESIEIPVAGGGTVTREVSSRNEAFLAKARFFLGNYTQEPSPDLEAIYGVGNTAAHRGLAYMVIVDEDVTMDGGMVPSYTFQVGSSVGEPRFEELRYGDPGVSRVVFSDSYLSSFGTTWTPPDGVTHVRFLLVGGGGTGRWVSKAGLAQILTLGVGVGGGGGEVVDALVQVSGNVVNIRNGSPNGQSVGATTRIGNVYCLDNGELVGPMTLEASPGAGANATGTYRAGVNGMGGHQSISIIYRGYNSELDAYEYEASAPDSGAGTAGNKVSSEEERSDGFFIRRYAGGVGSAGFGTYPTGKIAFAVQSPPHAELYSAFYGYPNGGGSGGGEGVYMGHIFGTDIGEAGWFAKGGQGTIFSAPGTVIFGNDLAGANGTGNGGSGPTAGAISGTAVVATRAGGRGLVVALYSLDAEERYAQALDGAKFLGAVLREILNRAGIPDSKIDTASVDSIPVNGIVITNQYPAFSAVKSLSDIYMFDLVKYDGKIRFVLRGGSSAATIAHDDMVFDEAGDESSKRADPVPIPRTLHLNYYDVNGSGLSTAKQTSERFGDRRAVGEQSMQTPVLIDADTAARVATITHKVRIEEQAGEETISLPDKWLFLTPADPVIVQKGASNFRYRIIKELILDGYQQYTIVRDRQRSYTSVVEGIPPVTVPVPVSVVAGPTVVMVLDIPLIKDSDDIEGLGYYVAVSGVSTGWSGAVVERSSNGGISYDESREITVGSVIGLLGTELRDHPREFIDYGSSFIVSLYGRNDSLTPSFIEGILAGENLAAIGNPEDGWELINFSGASLADESTNTWEISGPMLRGRRYTESKLHPEGSIFVLLTRGSVIFHPTSAADLGKTLTFRATSNGQTVDDATVIEAEFAGLAQREFPVSNVRYVRDGSTLHVSWHSAPRLGSGTSVAHSAYFTGYRVLVTDGANEVSASTVSKTASINVSSLSGPLSISVAQYNSLTGVGPWTTVSTHN